MSVWWGISNMKRYTMIMVPVKYNDTVASDCPSQRTRWLKLVTNLRDSKYGLTCELQMLHVKQITTPVTHISSPWLLKHHLTLLSHDIIIICWGVYMHKFMTTACKSWLPKRWLQKLFCRVMKWLRAARYVNLKYVFWNALTPHDKYTHYWRNDARNWRSHDPVQCFHWGDMGWFTFWDDNTW